MHSATHILRALAITTLALPLAVHAASLQQADEVLKAKATNSVVFKGTGAWYQFGQAPAPSLPWPKFDISNYQADINFEKPAERVQIMRKQVIEPGRNRPAPVEQKVDQYISGTIAWNLAVNATTNVSTASIQPAAVEERKAEILSTPQGFIRAALANNASSKSVKDGLEVSFTLDKKYQFKGIINNNNVVESVQTWIDNPVLGDTLYETTFADYKDQNGVKFPGHIIKKLGGYPILDLTVSDVQTNASVAIDVPADIASAAPPAINVVSTKLAEGVFYLTGGTHHSVAIEQADHVILVEAPLNEDRSLAVLAKVNEILPNKPVKFLINTHAHFDHLGGVRTLVDAGATIVTHKTNQAYYQKIWQQPHSLNPDKLALSKKSAKFQTFDGKLVIGDTSRKVEIYPLTGNSHNDAFALVYLPKEKIAVEADAYTPLAQGAPAPTSVNPYSKNLLENIQNLKLDVEQIAALHGPGVAKLEDLKAYLAIK